MQKRVAPSSLARVALSRTSSTLMSGVACTPVLIAGALGAVAAVLRTAAGLDAQEGTALDVRDVVMGAMHLGRPKDQLRQRQMIDGLEVGEGFHDAMIL